jgi:hypothetical protein
MKGPRRPIGVWEEGGTAAAGLPGIRLTSGGRSLVELALLAAVLLHQQAQGIPHNLAGAAVVARPGLVGDEGGQFRGKDVVIVELDGIGSQTVRKVLNSLAARFCVEH